MNQNAVQYLKENREKYPQEILAGKLREAGYTEEDVSESVKIVFGGERLLKPSKSETPFLRTVVRLGKILIIMLGGFYILVFLMASQNSGGHGKSPDVKRLGDVKQLQAALELYYDSCGGYPVVPTETIIGSPDFDISSHEGCPEGTSIGTFINPIPINPTHGGEPYAYYGSHENYTISFSLEKQSGNLSPGRHFATPSGVQ